MLKTPRAYGGMVTAPHHLAAESGAAVLREGGNAIEAMLAMAASIAVVYPHMNALGGDSFWLVAEPGEAPLGIQACGPAAAKATPEFYRERGHETLPSRGSLAALTVPGTLRGWAQAQALAVKAGGRLPLSRLLADAIRHGRDGIAVTQSQAALTREKLGELEFIPGFAETYLPAGAPPEEGQRLRQTALADTLARLAEVGLDDFHRGEIARAMARDLKAAGSPVALEDLEGFEASLVPALSVDLPGAKLFNMPPPTQGVSSLTILSLYARMQAREAEGFDFLHRLVEATKQAFIIRNAEVFDPACMKRPAETLLAERELEGLAAAIDPKKATPWPHPAEPGDTVWMGAIDAEGRAVSMIQSIYWEFGAGLVSPTTGVLFQNRGTSFSLEEGHANRLMPGRLPFHTLNPAMAIFGDGRRMVYGTMGGEGQPQTQAAVFARYGLHGQKLQSAVTAPRWLLGRTWGSNSTNLKLEPRFDPTVVDALRAAGHDTEVVADFNDMMGHAGAIVRYTDGLLEGASDPRSDGRVAAV